MEVRVAPAQKASRREAMDDDWSEQTSGWLTKLVERAKEPARDGDARDRSPAPLPQPVIYPEDGCRAGPTEHWRGASECGNSTHAVHGSGLDHPPPEDFLSRSVHGEVKRGLERLICCRWQAIAGRLPGAERGGHAGHRNTPRQSDEGLAGDRTRRARDFTLGVSQIPDTGERKRCNA